MSLSFRPALEMRSCQVDLERVEGQLGKRSQDVRELQARLQDAEKLLVSTPCAMIIHVHVPYT